MNRDPTGPVIFLDIDGPMIPKRADVLNEKIHGLLSLYKTFDAIAVALLLDVLDRVDGKLVIISTWRARGRDNFSEVAEKNGIDPSYLHEDWRTSVSLPMFTRAEQIQDWLDRHYCPKFAVLDDEELDIDNFVHVTYEDGMQWKHYLKLLEYLTPDDDTPNTPFSI